MLSLAERQRAANAILASYAVPHGEGSGREHAEPEDTTRFPVQRDRDRIIHAQAFRRLQGKTQVFVAGDLDHVRTRLTHTMEVAQISRDIARALSLNEDLAEAIALAHDVGHPPFGHAGETALDTWMQRHGERFEHNEQSERVVRFLERHTHLYPGLNLSHDILEGLRKHHTPFDHPATEDPSRAPGPSLEAQVVNLSDEIAYIAHDCDDGLRAELLSHALLTDTRLAASAAAHTESRGTSLRGGIIELLVRDLLQSTAQTLEQCGIVTLHDVRKARTPLVVFSDAMRTDLTVLHQLLYEHMYTHPRIVARTEEGQQIIGTLCEHLLEHPHEKVHALETDLGCTRAVAVKDYVAGMTENFAHRSYAGISRHASP